MEVDLLRLYAANLFGRLEDPVSNSTVQQDLLTGGAE